MDLRKIVRYEENFVKCISDEDIATMENRRVISGCYFQDSKCCFDFLNLSENNTVSLYIGNSTEDDERVYIEFTIIMSDGRRLEDCFWSFSIFPLMTFEELRAMSEPREFPSNSMLESIQELMEKNGNGKIISLMQKIFPQYVHLQISTQSAWRTYSYLESFVMSLLYVMKKV
jgi:hypothetical protein